MGDVSWRGVNSCGLGKGILHLYIIHVLHVAFVRDVSLFQQRSGRLASGGCSFDPHFL